MLCYMDSNNGNGTGACRHLIMHGRVKVLLSMWRLVIIFLGRWLYWGVSKILTKKTTRDDGYPVSFHHKFYNRVKEIFVGREREMNVE